MDITQFEKRKREHLELSLSLERQAIGFSGFDQINLPHDALPELSFDEVGLQTKFLGRNVQNPFFIASMTGGLEHGLKLNQTLAWACEKKGWALGAGSQRREIENKDYVSEWIQIREKHPDLRLMANLGASQLVQHGPHSRVLDLAKRVGAVGLIIHLNSLQEALQPEGTPQFRGVLNGLKELCQKSSIPIIVKETGCGFSKKALEKLRTVEGLSAIDVSGLGGTHWGRIEGARSPTPSLLSDVAQTFAHWGVPTVTSLRNAYEIFKDTNTEIWASGGVRTGLDAAKAIALKAQAVGFAQPALIEAQKGHEALMGWMEKREFELRLALYCTGSKDVQHLREQNWL